MDVAAYAMSASMQQVHNEASILLMGKAMDAEKMAAQMLVADFAAANSPAQMLAPKAGSMNIRV